MLRTTGLNNVLLVGSNTGFADENPPSQPLGTTVNAAWLNDVQENICSVIEGAGLTLSDVSFGSNAGYWQLLLAIQRLAGIQMIAGLTGNTTLAAGSTGNWIITSLSGNATITMPAQSSMSGSSEGNTFNDGRPLRISRVDQTHYTVTIQPAGGDTICFGNNNAGAFTLPPASRVELLPNSNIAAGSNWYACLTPLSPQPLSQQEWTAAGTYSFQPPWWATSAKVTMAGGGGGGGGSGSASACAGASGSGSALATFQIFFNAGQPLTVVVGAGGSGGSGSPVTAGGGGGTSSISYGGLGVVCQVGGGPGGLYGVAGPAAGGSSSGNPTANTISAGQYALLVGNQAATGGTNALTISSGSYSYFPAIGGSPNGVGVPLVMPGSTLYAPPLPGCGGYGGVSIAGSNAAGGPGAPGYVRIEY